ncbi:MAG: NlpC/P60 family protein [Pseudomonadota bacterium]
MTSPTASAFAETASAEAASRAQTLDRRLHAYRPDLAAESLRGRVEAARFVSGRPAAVASGVASLKQAPDHQASQDSELLYGEVVTLFDERDGWAWVQNQADGYVGYLEAHHLSSSVPVPTHTVAALRTLIFPQADIKTPPLAALSMTSPVAVAGREDRFARLDGGGWIFTDHLAPLGDWTPDYVASALKFLGVPYLWGGKNSLGLDCSGLVQIVLNRAGIDCPRDSDHQEGAPPQGFQNLATDTAPQRGDLIYFPGHVAIALDEATVVHANAHAMAVTIEPLAELVTRVERQTVGRGITTILRRPTR